MPGPNVNFEYVELQKGSVNEINVRDKLRGFNKFSFPFCLFNTEFMMQYSSTWVFERELKCLPVMVRILGKEGHAEMSKLILHII